MVFVCAGFFAFLVIFFDQSQLFAVGEHFCGAPFIHDAHRNAVVNRLRHRVGFNDIAEYVQSRVDGRSRKADIRRVRQRLSQEISETEAVFDSFFRHFDFLFDIDLRTVRFVGNDDDVAAVAQQPRAFGKFLNRCQKQPAAFASAQVLPQQVAVFDLNDRVVVNEFFGVQELLRQLVVQIDAVGYDENRRVVQFGRPHQLAAQKQHGEAFAAPRRAEISPAFAVADADVL